MGGPGGLVGISTFRQSYSEAIGVARLHLLRTVSDCILKRPPYDPHERYRGSFLYSNPQQGVELAILLATELAWKLCVYGWPG